MTQVSLDQLNSATKAAFVASVGDIFEHSPWVAEAAFASRPFASLAALFEAMTGAVKASSDNQQLALIKAHPDLAGKAARAGALTADSTSEQASAGLDRLTDEEFKHFHLLNDHYREKFGIPFIVCVRRHTKDSILHQFEVRLQHDAATERGAALAEIFRIVALRLDQRVAAPDRLQVHGRLSTHVLDTHTGRPASGVGIELFEVTKSGQSALVGRFTTNADGRTDKPLIANRPVPIGCYELWFEIGTYFAQSKVALPDPAFLDTVPVRFSVADAEGHYHVPLLVTPWSYSTYRGS